MRLLPLCVAMVVGCAAQQTGRVDAGTDAGVVATSFADGQVETWQLLAPLPTPVANHCAVAMGSALIIAGGNSKPDGGSDFISTDEVRAASVAADGTLGTWDLIGRLPSPGISCVFAASGTTLVLLGGLFQDDTLDGKVWSATLRGDGQLTSWVEVGTLPYGRRALTAGAALIDGIVWLTDAQLASEGTEESVLAHATLGTTLGTWTKTTYWAQFRGQPLGAFSADAAFIIGGYDDSGVLTDVTGIPLATQSFAPTTALPGARTYGAAAFVDGYLFATGGRTEVLGASPLPDVLSSAVTGAMAAAWATQTAMPEPRSNHTATVVGDWLFVVGGGNDGPGLDTVFRARVKHAPAQ